MCAVGAFAVHVHAVRALEVFDVKRVGLGARTLGDQRAGFAGGVEAFPSGMHLYGRQADFTTDRETHWATGGCMMLRAQMVRDAAETCGREIAIMADLQGPKIRIGKVANEPLMLKKGDKVTLTLDNVPGENGLISLPHPEFVRDIKVGMQLLLDDGIKPQQAADKVTVRFSQN